jgi:hypothetical protein
LLITEGESGTRPKGLAIDTTTEYLSNEEFLLLAKQGFIGTRRETTTHVRDVIARSLNAGNGVVAIIDESDPTLAKRLRHG